MNFIRVHTIRVSLIFVLFFLVNCEKDNCDIIPDVRVEFTLNLYTPPYNHLQAVGNSLEIPIDAGVYSAGYNFNGIILHRKLIDEFTAFDRTCTFSHDTPTAVNLSEDSPFVAVCPVCESKFYVSSGGIPDDNSKAQCPLKEYNADFYQAVNDVTVYNY